MDDIDIDLGDLIGAVVSVFDWADVIEPGAWDRKKRREDTEE